MSIARGRRRALRALDLGHVPRRRALRSILGRAFRYFYGFSDRLNYGLSYDSAHWARGDKAHRRFARFKKRYNVLSHTGRPTAIQHSDETIEITQKSPSVASDETLTSDRTETEPGHFYSLLVSLVQAERVRRATQPTITQLKASIQTKQDEIDSTMAEIRHLSRSQRPPSSSSVHASVLAGLLSRYERMLSLHMNERQELLVKMHELETRLSTAIAIQRETEPIMCRAVPGFIRHMQGVDFDEEILPRGNRFLLRAVADWSRSPLWRMVDGTPDGAKTATLRRGQGGEIVLNPLHEAAMRKANHHKLMRRFYSAIERTLVANEDLPPAEETTEGDHLAVSIPDSDEQASDSRRKALGDLATTRKALVDAREWLQTDLPKRYETDLDRYMRTYRAEPVTHESSPQQSSGNPFDREYMSRVWRANEGVRRAEINYIAAQNQAIEQKALDLEEEDLFGVADHASDGFTESMCSWQRTEDDLIRAEKRPSIHKWLQTAAGSPSEGVRTPSEVANIDTSLSERHALSCLDPAPARRDIMQRWEAERVVMRAEAENRWLEHYRALGKSPPRGIY